MLFLVLAANAGLFGSPPPRPPPTPVSLQESPKRVLVWQNAVFRNGPSPTAQGTRPYSWTDRSQEPQGVWAFEWVEQTSEGVHLRTGNEHNGCSESNWMLRNLLIDLWVSLEDVATVTTRAVEWKNPDGTGAALSAGIPLLARPGGKWRVMLDWQFDAPVPADAVGEV